MKKNRFNTVLIEIIIAPGIYHKKSALTNANVITRIINDKIVVSVEIILADFVIINHLLKTFTIVGVILIFTIQPHTFVSVEVELDNNFKKSISLKISISCPSLDNFSAFLILLDLV